MEGTGACFRKNRCLRRLWPSGGYGAGLASHRVLSAPQELVSKLLHLHFKDDKTRVSGDALLLTAELLKVFVVEAAIRSIRQAQAEDLPCVDVDQLEKVLPQLLLDF
ncbi:centromere protein X isoform X1 [Phyllostomus hastatus]|uniref:centromere protein X isoform X1 n=1 Tax=Phyllostomus hastatus TaxID=9423 RepID=UPI001E67F8F6|nr:centromere protein X isoform X1 [Phyllostomus hastatus]